MHKADCYTLMALFKSRTKTCAEKIYALEVEGAMFRNILK